MKHNQQYAKEIVTKAIDTFYRLSSKRGYNASKLSVKGLSFDKVYMSQVVYENSLKPGNILIYVENKHMATINVKNRTTDNINLVEDIVFYFMRNKMLKF